MEALTARLVVRILVGTAALLGAAVAVSAPPRLVVEAPAALAAYAREVERLDPTAFFPAMELTGLWEPGDVRVLVAPEGSPLARRAPSWAVAYADPPAGNGRPHPDPDPGLAGRRPARRRPARGGPRPDVPGRGRADACRAGSTRGSRWPRDASA